MLSINTNLSSLIAQNSMNSATKLLNQAVERMTTGYKINHASDNAANYSISTNMQTQISSYDVAADNVAMGMDLVTTASDIIANMQNKASRLQALSIQARNGTYGAQSMAAINSEAAAIMAEINRLYSTAEYNNISLFNRKAYEIDPSLPRAGASGFIEEPVATYSMRAAATPSTPVAKEEYNGFIEDPKTYTDAEVAAMTRVKDVSSFTSGEKYAIYTVEELQKLADYVNTGNDTTGLEFVLGADIDLSSISNWTPIGDNSSSSNRFKGIFDGNGHIIKNLTLDDETKNYQGLFGRIVGNSEIKNVGLEKVNVKGSKFVGGLVGTSGADITNSYATGNVTGTDFVGGLVGNSSSSISNSYATGNVTGTGGNVGGLAGRNSSSITNSYATGNVTGTDYVGGLAGHVYTSSSSITNSYATGNVAGTDYVGGLVGQSDNEITNSYATGNVTGTEIVGGLVGCNSYSTITDSYATGAVNGKSYVGGLVGKSNNISSSISNSYATGNVTGTGNVGGLAGNSFSISNSYATGNVTGTVYVGGLVGTSDADITNSYATGNVTGTENVGGLVGIRHPGEYSYINCYTTGSVTGDSDVGGIIGYAESSSSIHTTLLLDNCSTYSTVSGQSNVSSLFNANTTISNTTFSLSNVQYIAQDGVEPIITTGAYDLSTVLANTSQIEIKNTSTNLLVGINGGLSCQIAFDMNFGFNLSAIASDISSDSALAAIDSFINQLSEQETKLGAVQNRLESALESISVNIENLTSSLSTIRDADIAEVSSEYIRQQILQQASATLMATANQSPSIALQLI